MQAFKILLILLVFIFNCINVAIAAGPPGPPATPIDGGLSLLLAGGIAYGAHKVRQARQSKEH